MQKLGVVLACVLTMLWAGCEDSNKNDDGGNDASGVAGRWVGSGSYDNGVLITDFTLNLTQNGNSVGGSYDIQRNGRHMAGSISGTTSGNQIDMTFTPHGNASGTISGNTMSLNWWESGFGGDVEGANGTVTLTKQ
jgi:hypothetical protein